MLSLTLAQVVGKRKKLLGDMGTQMAAEVREGLTGDMANAAAGLVQTKLQPVLGQPASVYNVDSRFQDAVAEALKTKRTAELAAAFGAGDASGLASAMERVETLQGNVVELREWDVQTEGSAESRLVEKWMQTNPGGLTRLVVDWSKTCGSVRDALCKLAPETTTLVDLALTEKYVQWRNGKEREEALPKFSMSVLQANGAERIEKLEMFKGKYLGDGAISILAACVKSNPHCRTVDVSNVSTAIRFSGSAAAKLSAAVLANLGIEKFNQVPIKELRADSLTTLKLYSKSIGVAGGLVLAGLMTFASSLTSCDVRDNGISGDAASQLAAAVLNHPRIEAFNELPIKEMRADSLTELDMSRKKIGAEGGLVLAGLLSRMRSLTSLLLGSNQLDEASVIAICNAVKESKQTKLATLGLSVNSVGPIGARAVAGMVAGTASLMELQLGGNSYGDEGVEAICDAVRENKGGRLETLCINNSDVTPVGAQAVAAMLLAPSSLTECDLGSNKLKEAGVIAVCNAVKENKQTKLANLSLSRNDVSPKGGRAVAEAVAAMLSAAASLTKLLLFENKLGDEAANALAPAIAANATLTYIDLEDCKLGEAGKAAIRDAVSRSGEEGFELKI